MYSTNSFSGFVYHPLVNDSYDPNMELRAFYENDIRFVGTGDRPSLIERLKDFFLNR